MRHFIKSVVTTTIAMLAPAVPSLATVNYLIDDGTAEFTLGIDNGEDQIWFNTFPVAPGGERITQIQAAFGRPGLAAFGLNGFTVSVLLYDDVDGGSPENAVLRYERTGIISGAHTNTFVNYDIPPTEVHGTLFAAILFANDSGVNKPIAAVDRTAPTFPGRSWAAFAVDIDPNDLTQIPPENFNPIENFGAVGNLMVRAVGEPIPEPATLTVTAAALIALTSRRRSRR